MKKAQNNPTPNEEQEDKERLIKLCPGYVMKYDAYSKWIEREVPVTRGKNKDTGKTNWVRVSGYHDNYKGLFESFASQKIPGDEAREVESVLQNFKDTEDLLKQFCKSIGETLDRKEGK